MRTEGWWQPSPPQPVPECHHEAATCCSPLQTCQQRSAGPCRDPLLLPALPPLHFQAERHGLGEGQLLGDVVRERSCWSSL